MSPIICQECGAAHGPGFCPAHRNRGVASGVDTTLIMRDGETGDRAEILELMSGCLGEGYVTEDNLARYLPGDDEHFVITAHADDRLVGVLLAWRFVAKMGSIDDLAVDPGYRNRGVASGMCRGALRRFKDAGCDTALSTSWDPGEGAAGSKGLLERLGFEVMGEAPEYWYDDSLEMGYSCPRCGSPPCRCTAVLMVNRKL